MERLRALLLCFILGEGGALKNRITQTLSWNDGHLAESIKEGVVTCGIVRRHAYFTPMMIEMRCIYNISVYFVMRRL